MSLKRRIQTHTLSSLSFTVSFLLSRFLAFQWQHVQQQLLKICVFYRKMNEIFYICLFVCTHTRTYIYILTYSCVQLLFCSSCNKFLIYEHSVLKDAYRQTLKFSKFSHQFWQQLVFVFLCPYSSALIFFKYIYIHSYMPKNSIYASTLYSSTCSICVCGTHFMWQCVN